MIIDTHCHLDHTKYQENIKDILNRAISVGVKKFIIPGADPKTLKRAVKLSEEFKEIYFAVGVHPCDIENYNINIFESFASHKKCVAIGECGLDYFRIPKELKDKKEEIKKQKDIFIKQINIANKFKLPLIVHIRDASLDALEILNKNIPEKGGVLHCYNADESLLSLANKNFYFGIGGVITFKNAEKLRNSSYKIPKEKFILETDSPYLTPHPNRGKVNEPSQLKFIINKIIDLNLFNKEEVQLRTTENAIKLFSKIEI